MNLPIYNFVINCTDAELEGYMAMDVEKDAAVFCRWDLEWGLQTFLYLSRRGKLPVILSNRMRTDCVNIVHSAQLLEDGGNARNFIVCIRADFPFRRWAHFHIVQNHTQLGPSTAPTLLWIQPGLIGRDPNRNCVSRVAYAGQTFNGNLAGSEESWKALFAQHGIEFITLTAGNFSNLADVDVLIGIRSFDTNPHNTKPPSKMINAWHARIPFVGGYDSAYTQVGIPGQDYLQVKSPEETLAAVLRLKQDPDLYAQLVHNGAAKSAGITNEAITENWERLLTGPVLARYEKWKAAPLLETARTQALKGMGIWEHRSKQLAKKLLGAGAIKKLKSRLGR